MQLHAGLVVIGVAAVAGHAHVAGGHAAHGALFVVQHFDRGEAGKMSTPSASACSPIHLTTSPRRTM